MSMEQAVTHDALVQFAAEKLGVELEPIIEERLFEPIYEPGDTACSSELGCQRIITGYVIKGTKELFDLNSWDLFGKGLAALEAETIASEDDQGVKWSKTVQITMSWIKIATHIEHKFIVTTFGQFCELPLAFWRTWYEVEHGKS